MNTSAYDGLYYSLLTNRIFEAIRKDDKFIIKYADDQYPKTKKIPFGTFVLQNEVGFYETLVDYYVETM